VIALALGNIRTEGLERYGDDLEAMAADVPLGRLGTPDEVAVATAFLASPAAGYVSGTTVTIDGGLDAS
jgi:NAD(P)-dependent dehydrogenase (short-subunit alcohol dehydrogenase family)